MEGQALDADSVCCIAFGLVGIVLVATKGDLQALHNGAGVLWPMLLMVSAVICWCTFTVGASLFPSWSPLRYTTLTCLMGTASNLAVTGGGTGMGWLDPPAWQDVISNLWPFAYMAFIAGVAAVLAWNVACKHISPVAAALFTNNIIPVVSSVITVLSGYRMGAVELSGIALTLLVLVVNNVAGRRGARKSQAMASAD